MKTTEEMIEVMEAYAAGKEIEFRYLSCSHDRSWGPAPNPCWNWPQCDYRIKEVPREFTIAYREDTGKVLGVAGFPGGSMIQIVPADCKVGMVKTMRVREVL